MRCSFPGRRFGLGFLATLVFSVALLGLSFGTQSAQAQAPAKPSAAVMALAKQLVEVNGEAQAFYGVIPNIVEGAARSFLPTNPDLANQLSEAANAILPEFEKRKGEIVDILAGTYATHFTEAELKEAVAFYKTPTGKKLVEERPTIGQETLQAIQAWGAQVNALAVEKVRAEMKKKGFDI